MCGVARRPGARGRSIPFVPRGVRVPDSRVCHPVVNCAAAAGSRLHGEVVVAWRVRMPSGASSRLGPGRIPDAGPEASAPVSPLRGEKGKVAEDDHNTSFITTRVREPLPQGPRTPPASCLQPVIRV